VFNPSTKRLERQENFVFCHAILRKDMVVKDQHICQQNELQIPYCLETLFSITRIFPLDVRIYFKAIDKIRNETSFDITGVEWNINNNSVYSLVVPNFVQWDSAHSNQLAKLWMNSVPFGRYAFQIPVADWLFSFWC